ncbi:MAG: AAA family ATPase [Ruminiclostridium sp.]|nr:AAA family ATPase [Ruminiclostridium sp.]
MGNIYIFRGKAATGKSTLANMLAEKLSIPVFCKDDIVDALKMSKNIEKGSINNEVCYNILYKIIQTNLDLHTNFILDIALADTNNAKWFFGRLDFNNNNVIKFFIDCSDEDEWTRRHIERLKNPLPHQSFKSIEHVVDHYKKADIYPFEDEYVIDNTESVGESFNEIIKIINDSLTL